MQFLLFGYFKIRERYLCVMSAQERGERTVFVLIAVILLFVLGQTSLGATASFQGLGYLPGGSSWSDAYGVSADGSAVVGASDSPLGWGEAYRWTEATGMVGLGDLPGGSFDSYAESVSADGSVVVGGSESAAGFEGFRWTQATGMVGLGDLPGGSFDSYAESVSADGSVVVGFSESASDYEAFRWTQATGMVGLGDLPGGVFYSEAMGVSADGSVIVGSSESTSGFEAFRWTQASGMVGLGELGGGVLFYSEGLGISDDGSVIVGGSESALGLEAYRWTEATGMEGLGDLPGGDFYSQATGVSADGSVVVGFGKSDLGWEAFIWDADNGMRNLKEVLENDFGLDLTGGTLEAATGISDYGLMIVGWGINPEGFTEAWIANLPATYYVDDDGPADFNSIQTAIDAVNDGDTIIVKPGLYTGDGNRDIDFLGKAITVRSTNPNDPDIVAATVIDCQGSEADPHRGFYFHSGEGMDSIVAGFTITDGYGPEEEMSWGDPMPMPAGGAFFCSNSSPKIVNCVIEGNSAVYGGALFCDGSSMMLINCTISNNSAGFRGGGMYNYQSNGVTVTNCTFINNYGERAGGGILNSNSSPTLIGCTFTSNSAPLVQLTFGGGGGICNIGGSPILTNCVFSGNWAGWGGAVSNEASTPKIINCTFNGNVGGGNAMVNWSEICVPIVRNCILWDGGNEIWNKLGATADVTYCDIQGGWLGLGNIDVDPCFVESGYWDPNGTPADTNDDFWVEGDYHLQSQAGRWDVVSESWVMDAVTSPCIDAGNPGCPVGDEPEANGNRINMGAYGGTAEASKSPADWHSIADLNNDWVVNFDDAAVFVSYWLESGQCIPADLNRSEAVDFLDYAIFATNLLVDLPSDVNLVAHWTMDDNADNTTVLDSSDNGNHGAAQQNTSILHIAGVIDGALTFNGSTDYIDCGNDSSLDITGSITLSAWVNPDSLNGTIISKRTYDGGPIAQYLLDFDNNDLRLLWYNGGWKGISYDASGLAGQWSHVVCTYDADSNVVALYVNGSPVASDTEPSGLVSNTVSVKIGAWFSGDVKNAFSGTIDDVRIFDRALPPGEVEVLYNQ